MAKPVPLPPPGFDDLSIDEKIDYLQSLWDRIAATPETTPVPEVCLRATDLMSHGAMSWSANLPTIPTTSSSGS